MKICYFRLKTNDDFDKIDLLQLFPINSFIYLKFWAVAKNIVYFLFLIILQSPAMMWKGDSSFI